LKRQAIKRHYRVGFLGLLPLTLILTFVDISIVSKLFFWLSYVWNFSLRTPGIQEKVSHRRYRYSFLRLVYFVHQFFSASLQNKIPQFLIVSVSPLAFISLLFLFTKAGNPLLGLLGSIIYEVIFNLERDYHLKKLIYLQKGP